MFNWVKTMDVSFDVRTRFLFRLRIFKRGKKIPHEIEILKTCHQTDSNLRPSNQYSNAVPLSQQLQLPNQQQIFAIYAIALLMSTVASPDPYPREGGQLPNPNECNSTLTSELGVFTATYIKIRKRSLSKICF